MSGEQPNGIDQARLARLEKLVVHWGDSHEKLLDSQKHLLFAQGVLHEEVVQLAKAQAVTEQRLQELAAHTDEGIKELAESQKHTDERIGALINIVDDLVRKRPQ